MLHKIITFLNSCDSVLCWKSSLPVYVGEHVHLYFWEIILHCQAYLQELIHTFHLWQDANWKVSVSIKCINTITPPIWCPTCKALNLALTCRSQPLSLMLVITTDSCRLNSVLPQNCIFFFFLLQNHVKMFQLRIIWYTKFFPQTMTFSCRGSSCHGYL